MILFCVLFGLSMDYEVFLLSRMKEVWDATGDNTEAVARGLERSGRIVTSAALIVVVVAGSFAFADIVLIKALGLGVAIAVALDATVVRALLVPATMRLLGRWNWWMPASLERFVGEPAAGVGGRGAKRRWPGEAPRRPVRGSDVVVAGVHRGGPILANAAGAAAIDRRHRAPDRWPAADPVPIVLPRDDGPHDRLTEWWYYTGHLVGGTDDGARSPGGSASSS